jgi:hypothetical protein
LRKKRQNPKVNLHDSLIEMPINLIPRILKKENKQQVSLLNIINRANKKNKFMSDLTLGYYKNTSGEPYGQIAAKCAQLNHL